MKSKKTQKKTGSCIESVTTTEKGVEVMFTGVRLVFDGISEVVESEYEGTTTYNFKAGIEIPEGKELDALMKSIRETFSKKKIKGWSPDVALEHFDEKKFQPAQTPGCRILYPSAPAEQVDSGFRPKGRLYVNPSHDAFYAGCYVDAKVAFVANQRGAITIKDYLNGIRFADDGEPISGASDPWEGSQSKAVVGGVKKADAPAKKEEEKKKGSGKKHR